MQFGIQGAPHACPQCSSVVTPASAGPRACPGRKDVGTWRTHGTGTGGAAGEAGGAHCGTPPPRQPLGKQSIERKEGINSTSSSRAGRTPVTRSWITPGPSWFRSWFLCLQPWTAAPRVSRSCRFHRGCRLRGSRCYGYSIQTHREPTGARELPRDPHSLCWPGRRADVATLAPQSPWQSRWHGSRQCCDLLPGTGEVL